MKRKIGYCLLIVILIACIIITATKGIKVDLNYAEGDVISFSTDEKDIDMDKLDNIAKEVFGKHNYLIKKVEFFDNSALIKVKEIKDGDLQSLADKINAEMETNFTTASFTTDHVTNTKISSIIEPYIIPIGLSLLLIVAYYAVRFKGSKQMIKLIRNVVAWFLVYYAIYAIGRVPFSGLTMPILMGLYILVVAFSTFKYEKEIK
jgi:preprotein translocase subunit SecF